MTISVDSNQSSRTPRASTSCTAASAVASAMKPVQSKRTFVEPSLSGGSVQRMPIVAQTPIGTSM